MLEWAGVGFGEEQSVMVCKSLERLAVTSSASSIKLFGKIQGTEADYWVAQGVLKEAEEVPTNKKQEIRGKGTNAIVFWVTHNLMNDWIQLPECQPEHIIAAKMIVRTMTGNLNAAVDSCPPFCGKERHLLRAQLARIHHSTQLCPKGLFEMDDETLQQKYAEDFTVPATDDLKALEAWGHEPQLILNAGRCTHSEPVGMEDEAKEEYMAKLNDSDKTEERFKTIAEDSVVKGQAAWLSKVAGDS